MKRYLQIIFVLPVLAAMLLSCENTLSDEKARVTVEGLEDSYSFEAIPDGKVEFRITSNVTWHLDVEGLDWIRLSPGRGLGSAEPQVVTIEPIANEDENPRSGTMTVKAGDFSRTVTLTQAAASITPELKFVEGVGQDGVLYIDSYNLEGESVKLYSNRDWTASAEAMDEWAVVGPLKGEQGRYSTIAVVPIEPNEDSADRIGEIVFTYGGQTKVLSVCHRRFVAQINILKGDVPVTSVDALSIGETFELILDVNADWTVSSDSGWLRSKVSEGVYGKTAVAVEVDPNMTGARRSGKLTFVSSGVSVDLTVNQGDEYIMVSEEKFSIAKEGGNLSVALSANVEWVSESTQSWLTVNPSAGNGNADVTIKVEASSSDDMRYGVVTFRAKNIPGIFKVVTVTQSASYIDLTIPLLFNSSDQSWNMTYNPDYASAGQTGAVTGKGTGRVCSYTYPTNEMIYAQVIPVNLSYGMVFIMAAQGNITFKKIWTGDAVEFHIPVASIEKGKTLHFDFGVMGTSQAPKFWNAEISLDGGSGWESLITGTNETSAGLGVSSNVVLPGSTNTERSYKATYKFSKTIEKAEIIVRVVCVDGTVQQNGTKITSPHKSGTFRIIGADHSYDGDANNPAVVKGPKFYID